MTSTSNPSHAEGARLPSTLEPSRRELIAALQRCGIAAEYCAHTATGLRHGAQAIEACRDASSLCRAAAELLARRSGFERWLVPAALLASEVCASECALHSDVFFRDCVQACQQLRAAADRVADEDPRRFEASAAGARDAKGATS